MHARFKGVAIAGIGAAVPANDESISALVARADDRAAFTLKRVAALAGLERRHVAPATMYSGDIALAAARSLLGQLAWEPATLDALFFVTQTPDFLSPPTGYLIGGRLGVGAHCAIMDLTSGCPGMVHGAWLACGQMGPGCRRALVIAGDASSKVVPRSDVGNSVLMGDGMGALALEWRQGASEISFHLLSSPDMDFRLVNYASGYRPTPGKPDGMVMDGNKITQFCLAAAPGCMAAHLEREGLTLKDVDMLYLHQPNKMILETLKRRLAIDAEKIPQIFRDYANCSSASLAINVCSHPGKKRKQPLRALFCAFGSGLAVASMLAEWKPERAYPVVLVEEAELMKRNQDKTEESE